MPKYVEESYQDNLVDCPLDPAYCEMSDPEALPDYKTGSRLIYGLVVDGTDAAAQKLLLYCKYQTALEDLRLFLKEVQNPALLLSASRDSTIKLWG